MWRLKYMIMVFMVFFFTSCATDPSMYENSGRENTYRANDADNNHESCRTYRSYGTYGNYNSYGTYDNNYDNYGTYGTYGTY
jgi:hypothetical protein